METNFQKKDNGFRVAGSIIAVKSKSSKGGAVQILIECPLNSALAQSAFEFFEKAGAIDFSFSEDQPELPGMNDDFSAGGEDL